MLLMCFAAVAWSAVEQLDRVANEVGIFAMRRQVSNVSRGFEVSAG